MKKFIYLVTITVFISFSVKSQNTPWLSNSNGIYYDTLHVSINIPTPNNPMEFSLFGKQIIYGKNATLMFGDTANTSAGWGEYGIEYNYNGGQGGLNFWKPYGNSYDNAVKNWILFLKDDGRVCIGTYKAKDGYLLTVAGGINAREVLVTADAGADFVFEKGFQLKSLPELENYVKTNKHLPDIPSADDMKKNGLKTGEFQIKLLQKIEELTLYVIKQQKEIEELKSKLSKK